MAEVSADARWSDLKRVFDRESAFTPDFEAGAGDDLLEALQDEETRVLVIGAGGLGCEILKDVALSGIRNIDCIDLDKIDVTNLNRQFLFRRADVDQYKSHVAARFVMQRCPGVTINAHTDPIQKFDEEFFRQFSIIIAGLDNVEARRWINAMVHTLNNPEEGEEGVTCFLIDGGTEGFQGQARVIVPYVTACYECTMDTLPPDNTFPLCTIKETPRLPEHCIQYALIIEWEKNFQRPVDKDSPEDMQWICEKATERADHYGITGVDYKKTMGVVKNIIPAVASTNALISAACVNECLKLLTGINKRMDNYMQYLGQTRLSISTLPYERRHDCLVCSRAAHEETVNINQKLSDLKETLTSKLTLKNPALQGTKGFLIGAGVFAS